MFKKQINLSIKSEKYSTKLGAFVSIFMYSVAIFLVGYYFKKIVDRKLQNIIIKDLVMDRSLIVTLTDYVPYIVRIEDQMGNPFLNKSIFSVEAFYYHCEYADKCRNLRLNMTNCKLDNFPKKYEESYNMIKLDSALCINFKDNPQLSESITLS